MTLERELPDSQRVPTLGAGRSYLPSITNRERNVSTPERRGGIGGISLGGIIVIVGIVVMIAWSILLGLIIVLIGLIAFGGFARGRWY
jgi:hypothetical protein